MKRIQVYVAMALMSAAAAQAQEAQVAPATDAEAAAAAEDSEIQSVTVSARRREENAQSVPIPISALSGDDFARAGQFRTEELNQRLPSTNVQFGNPRQTSIAVRGLGNNPANDALESSVGVYLDNVYLGRPGMANLDLIDIEQIALLRGPQGTLFGKNTTAGVLNLTTRQPSFDPQFNAETSGGDYGYYQVRAAATGPLLGDTLAGRISYARSHKDGFIDDITDGRQLNGYDREGIRGQLLYKPSDSFDLRLIADYNSENSNCCSSALYNLGPNGGAVYLGFIQAIGANAVFDPKYRTVTIDSPQHMLVHQGGYSAEANWQLGRHKLTSITAYRDWRFIPTNDADGLDLDAITNAGQQVSDDQWSQELRIASPSGERLEYVAGLYYFYQHQSNQIYTFYGPDAGLYTGRPFFNNASSTTNQFLSTSSYSAFAQATWKLNDRWSLTGGARETYEDKTTFVRRNEATGSPIFQGAFPFYESGLLKRNDSTVSALASLSFQATDDMLWYGSIARGAKAGGINPSVPTAGLTTDSLYVDPEKVLDYELGFKSSWLGRHLQLNANLFWVDVTDYQATQLIETSPGVFTQNLSNIGKVRSKGVEAEFQAVPLEGLTFSLNGSYNDAKYRSYANAPCSSEALVAGLRVCDLSGEGVVGAPKWIASAATQFEHALTERLSGFAGAEYSWRSSFYGSADNSELARVESFGILNLRAGISGGSDERRWTFSVWAKNLTDEVYTLGGLSTASATLQYAQYPGSPRALGATLRVDF